LSGKRHIITAIDYATRWVEAEAVESMDEETVANFLYCNIFMRYGSPVQIISDRGSSFLSEGIRAYEEKVGVRHTPSAPYHPQTNGMVERMHAMLGHGITTLSQSQPTRWDEYLPETLFAVRARRHAVTRFSPFFLLYGIHPRLPKDTHPPLITMQPLTDTEFSDFQAERNARGFEDIGMSRRAAFERSEAQARRMRERTNLNPDSEDYVYSVGSWVKRKRPHSKFEYRWEGPYQVVDLGFPGTYWLMKPDGTRLDSTINQADLAPWLGGGDSVTARGSLG
jgi:transposase InsO family protein